MLIKRLLTSVSQSLAELPDGGRVFLAVSGGLDSMLLLEAAARLKDERKLHVVHVNHGMRGKSSEADARFVKSAAERLGLPFHLTKLKGMRGQLACRKARHTFFQSLANRESDRIFLAHHLDDQAETVLLRLLRGTGVRGLAGMRRKSGKLVRPFLAFSKEEIRSVASEWNLVWREDGSNLSPKYERNWLRLEILPLLEARRGGVSRRLAALAEEIAATKQTLRDNSDRFDWNGVSFYRNLPRSTAHLSKIFGIDRTHSAMLAKLLAKGSGIHTAEGVRFSLSCGVTLVEREQRLDLIQGHFDGASWHSPFGNWQLETVLRQGGDSWKKRCQEAGIPVFFRTWIPYVEQSGKKKLSLESFEPSELGIWFFTPSPKRDAQARGLISKEKTRPALQQ